MPNLFMKCKHGRPYQIMISLDSSNRDITFQNIYAIIMAYYT